MLHNTVVLGANRRALADTVVIVLLGGVKNPRLDVEHAAGSDIPAQRKTTISAAYPQMFAHKSYIQISHNYIVSYIRRRHSFMMSYPPPRNGVCAIEKLFAFVGHSAKPTI
eukprot:COSAG03_NODE_6069_length_1120_cov_4.011753_1_plen_111_part_00